VQTYQAICRGGGVTRFTQDQIDCERPPQGRQSFSKDDVERAKAMKSLAAEIGRSTKLIKAGRDFKCCCPLHQEKTASMMIYESQARAHCFGCGWNGDIIKYLHDKHGYSFADAMDYLTGGAQKSDHKGKAPIIVQRPQRPEDEVVKSIIVANHIRSLAQPIKGTLVERYLSGSKRKINLDAIEGYTDVLGFVPDCPMGSWTVGKSHRDVARGPAMVAPFHSVERVHSMIYNKWIIRTEYRGMHVTYLNADGTDKVSGYWPNGNEITQRKMYGNFSGCAILFTPMDTPNYAPLLNGEGIENTLSALNAAQRSTPILRVCSTMSLLNHQGEPIKDSDGATPLYNLRFDRDSNPFGFDYPGDVISVIDADMKPHKINVRRTRGGPASVGIEPQERTNLCDTLITQKWKRFHARSHVTITPPDGMDFNDHWRDVNATT
jgi:DNA primase